jgi:hypothetical protein
LKYPTACLEIFTKYDIYYPPLFITDVLSGILEQLQELKEKVAARERVIQNFVLKLLNSVKLYTI